MVVSNCDMEIIFEIRPLASSVNQIVYATLSPAVAKGEFVLMFIRFCVVYVCMNCSTTLTTHAYI